eukprot:6210442-Heterocapsa_arctica.AAC.1
MCSDWWVPRAPPPVPQAPPAPDVEDLQDGRDGQRLTTLGVLGFLNHYFFGFYEWRYLKFVRMCLTTDWPILQGGSDYKALRKWITIFEFLELDRKA